MQKITVTKAQEGQTIYKLVKKYLSDAPISVIEKLFRIKDVKINNKRVHKDEIVKENDEVIIYINDTMMKDFSKPKIVEKFKNKPVVIYEDENILICNKPSGLLVHGDASEKRLTLTNIVQGYLYEKGEYDPSVKGFTPGPAHRIDRNTSGLVIYGKNIMALQELENLFKERNNIEKHYLALVNGRIVKGGEINKPLFKDEEKGMVYVRSEEKGGKPSITKYEVEEVFEDSTLIDAEILTGRTHQIRVHFASINHPLLGDAKYGDFNKNKEFKNRFNYEGQFLHSYKFIFHEINGLLSYLSNKEFKASLGDKEKKIINELRKENQQ